MHTKLVSMWKVRCAHLFRNPAYAPAQGKSEARCKIAFSCLNFSNCYLFFMGGGRGVHRSQNTRSHPSPYTDILIVPFGIPAKGMMILVNCKINVGIISGTVFYYLVCYQSHSWLGVDNPGHPFIMTVGCVAGDEESYEVFADLLDPVIDKRHGGYSKVQYYIICASW